MVLLRSCTLWGALLVALVAVVTAATRWFSSGLAVEPETLLPILYWSTFANTALGGATILYFVHGLLHLESVGRPATALALLGVAGGAFAFLAHWLGIEATPAVTVATVGLFELTAGSAMVAVAAYLVAESHYRNRTLAMLVMPAVMLAIGCEIWLASQGAVGSWVGPVALSGYWDAAYRLATVLGYSALAAAAVAGVSLLVAARESVTDPRMDLGRWFGGTTRAARGNLVCAITVGVTLLLFAGGLGMFLVFEHRAFGESLGLHLLPALVAYAILCFLGATRAVADRSIGTLSIAVFVATTIVLEPPALPDGQSAREGLGVKLALDAPSGNGAGLQ